MMKAGLKVVVMRRRQQQQYEQEEDKNLAKECKRSKHVRGTNSAVVVVKLPSWDGQVDRLDRYLGELLETDIGLGEGADGMI